MLLTLAFVVVCARWSSREAGYLVAVVASQVVSPIMWTHYALILLLPVAWLLNRRHWWAAIVPVSHAWVALPFVPLDIYPLAFYGLLVALPVMDRRRVPGTQAGA
jgi:hypothetical protein